MTETVQLRARRAGPREQPQRRIGRGDAGRGRDGDGALGHLQRVGADRAGHAERFTAADALGSPLQQPAAERALETSARGEFVEVVVGPPRERLRERGRRTLVAVEAPGSQGRGGSANGSDGAEHAGGSDGADEAASRADQVPSWDGDVRCWVACPCRPTSLWGPTDLAWTSAPRPQTCAHLQVSWRISRKKSQSGRSFRELAEFCVRLDPRRFLGVQLDRAAHDDPRAEGDVAAHDQPVAPRAAMAVPPGSAASKPSSSL